MDYEQQLKEIVRSEDWLMELLRTVRTLGLHDWYIAAGAIRNTVWDRLHGFTHTPLQDVDVVYFTRSDLRSSTDTQYEALLEKKQATVTWNVFNQARAHLRSPGREPARCTEDGVKYWPETPTCVGVRLETDDSLTILAPWELRDLFALVIRPIPEPFLSKELYQKRQAKKKWKEKWPQLTYVN
ncbi:hypothetical protein GF342_02410 [Candidatus Woesearchaeota archaeon]|nr:hypothetical protein [Candidatus Woesearchaeota archaeon]